MGNQEADMQLVAEPTDTGNGFIVGTDPKEPVRTSAQWAEVQAETMAGGPNGIPGLMPTPGAPTSENPPESRYYTDEDVERIRREEKDKLYGRIQTMDEQLKTLVSEREAREAELRAQQEAESEARRREEEEKMEVRDLLERRTSEMQQRIDALQSEREVERAAFEKERQFQELISYRQGRIEQESEYIIPELRDLVVGNSPEEVDASIEQMKQRTAAILGQMQASVSTQRQQMRGAAPTAPPVGPLEQMQSYESITPDDIRSMDMETYKRFRGSLLDGASRAYRGG